MDDSEVELELESLEDEEILNELFEDYYEQTRLDDYISLYTDMSDIYYETEEESEEYLTDLEKLFLDAIKRGTVNYVVYYLSLIHI